MKKRRWKCNEKKTEKKRKRNKRKQRKKEEIINSNYSRIRIKPIGRLARFHSAARPVRCILIGRLP